MNPTMKSINVENKKLREEFINTTSPSAVCEGDLSYPYIMSCFNVSRAVPSPPSKSTAFLPITRSTVLFING